MEKISFMTLKSQNIVADVAEGLPWWRDTDAPGKLHLTNARWLFRRV